MNQRSVEVYRLKVEPTIKKRHERVMAAIKLLQPCTSLEVADHLNVPLHSISGRFTELSKPHEYGRPIIECVGSKKNRYGNECSIWQVKVYKSVEQTALF